MDQSGVLLNAITDGCCRVSTPSSYKIDLDQEVPFISNGGDGGGNTDENGLVSLEPPTEKKKLARRRWAILAKALKSPIGSQPSSPTDEISIERRISSFMLLKTIELPHSTIHKMLSNLNGQINSLELNQMINKRNWYQYSMEINNEAFSIYVSHRSRTFSAEDLMGFNNTGNICIWPSEETLSYYICSNLSLFNGKTVLELGGGMSCLAGLFLAKYSKPYKVLVTDGNRNSIENVQVMLHCNQFACPTTQCAILKWNDESITPAAAVTTAEVIHHHQTNEQFDVILSADCLFFDEARMDFINCLFKHLASTGIAYVMAPERGGTLDNFIIQSELKGLACKKVMNYNDVVWRKRFSLMDNCQYNDNIHYPILIEVTKKCP